MNDENEENILYGGQVPPLNDGFDAKSLGEVVLKKLAIRGDDLMYVSGQQSLKMLFSFYSIRFNFLNTIFIVHL